MQAMCDEIHGLGLKVGIYSTPWETSYAGYVGGSSDNADGFWVRSQRRTNDAASDGTNSITSTNRIYGRSLGKYSFADNDAKFAVSDPLRIRFVRVMYHAVKGG